MIDKNSGNVEDVSKQTSQTEQVNFKEHFRTIIFVRELHFVLILKNHISTAEVSFLAWHFQIVAQLALGYLA